MSKKDERWVLVRTYAMGVYFGVLETINKEQTLCTLRNARNIWYWDGAASLLEMAQYGVSKPKDCKFTVSIDKIELSSPQGLAVLDVTAEAKKSIDGVKEWRA